MPFASVAGVNLYYETHGEGSPLLLITGLGGSCRGWLALQVPAFATAHRTVIYDHRGVGESEDRGQPYSIGDLADDAAALLESLGIERAHVLGSFMGGMVAQELALRHPERVDRLVLVGTYARPDAKRRLLIETWLDLAQQKAPPERLLRERVLWTLTDETFEQRDLIERMLAGYRDEGFPLSFENLERQCHACLAHDTAERLPDLSHPTLVVCGEQDALTPPRLHRALVSSLSDAHLVTIPSAAHLVMVEAAERFNDAVLQFLSEAR